MAGSVTPPVMAAVLASMMRAGGTTLGCIGVASGTVGGAGLTSTFTFAGGVSVVPGTGGDGETALFSGGFWAGLTFTSTSLCAGVLTLTSTSTLPLEGGVTSTVVPP